MSASGRALCVIVIVDGRSRHGIKKEKKTSDFVLLAVSLHSAAAAAAALVCWEQTPPAAAAAGSQPDDTSEKGAALQPRCAKRRLKGIAEGDHSQWGIKTTTQQPSLLHSFSISDFGLVCLLFWFQKTKQSLITAFKKSQKPSGKQIWSKIQMSAV